MKKNQEPGLSRAELEALSPARKQAMKRDIEKQRLDVVKEIEELLSDISKQKRGKSLRMKHPKRLGRRPNDTLER